MGEHVIAVDGPAASGKGTLARRLAAHFDYAYLDTGALYRAVALGVLQAGGDALMTQPPWRRLKILTWPNWMSRFCRCFTDRRDRSGGLAGGGQAACAGGDFAGATRFRRHPAGWQGEAVLDGRYRHGGVRKRLFITARASIRAARRRKLLAQGARLSAEVLAISRPTMHAMGARRHR